MLEDGLSETGSERSKAEIQLVFTTLLVNIMWNENENIFTHGFWCEFLVIQFNK